MLEFWVGFEKQAVVSKAKYDQIVRELMKRIGGEATGNRVAVHGMRSAMRGSKLPEGFGKTRNALNFDMRRSSLHDVGSEFGSKAKEMEKQFNKKRTG